MRAHAPAAERNAGPILEVLRTVLPAEGLVLEIASGTGQHAVRFARELPNVRFQPSDADPGALDSIVAWSTAEPSPGLLSPLCLDVQRTPWPLSHADAIVCINMIHIAPWAATEALFQGGARVLSPGAPLVLYGPFRFGGQFLAESNAVFDASLRGRDPRWGVRDVDDVTRVASAAGFVRERIVPMPANNHSVVFRRVPASEGAS